MRVQLLPCVYLSFSGKPSIVTIEQGDDKPDDAKFTEFNALLPHTRTSCGCFTKQLEPESAESAGADDEVQGFKPTLFRVSDNGEFVIRKWV